MPLVQCACPQCGKPLQLNQQLPVRVQCPGCATVFTVGQAATSGAAAPPTSNGETLIRRWPAPRKSVLPWILTGIGFAAVSAVVVLLILRAGKGEGEGGPPGPLPRGGSRQVQIQAAVDRGVSFVRKQILEGEPEYHYNDPGAGSYTGVVALGGLTLLECGLSPSDEAVQKAIKTVRDQAPRLRFTYSLALAILFLDRFCEGKDSGHASHDQDKELIRTFAVRLMAAQKQNGGWGYYCDPLSPEEHVRLLALVNEGKPLAKGDEGHDDNSINQFVTLALWAARKYGVKTQRALKATEKRYRDNQHKDGSWGYRARDTGDLRDSTTCAGLISLAVGRATDREALEKKDDKGHAAPDPKGADVTKDPAIEKALKFVGHAVGKDPRRLHDLTRKQRQKHTQDMMALHRKWHSAGPDEQRAIKSEIEKLDKAPLLRGTYFGSDSWGDLYFLWSVERVAVVFDLKLIDGKDWYGWGLDIILSKQEQDGSWRDRFPGICDTCFALLFLKRANVAKDLTDKLRTVTARPSVRAVPPRRPEPAAPPARLRDA
ncbi:MAG: hypothetical protein L0Z62_23760 [Gemmataceae bacterium]|nr:hypothetical protein [Gemmataceae bacterium]